MIDAYWYASARVAWEGQSAYSRRPTGTKIGEDGRLWRVTQAHGATASAAPVWLTLFPLGNEIPTGDGASIFAVGRDVSGYSEAYTVSGGGELTRFWQSPSSGQWFEEHVQLARGDNQMVPVQTHALELSVLNEDGLPQVDVPISIQASSLVTLFVNGKSYRASQVDRVAAKTGPLGKVVIHNRPMRSPPRPSISRRRRRWRARRW